MKDVGAADGDFAFDVRPLSLPPIVEDADLGAAGPADRTGHPIFRGKAGRADQGRSFGHAEGGQDRHAEQCLDLGHQGGRQGRRDRAQETQAAAMQGDPVTLRHQRQFPQGGRNGLIPGGPAPVQKVEEPGGLETRRRNHGAARMQRRQKQIDKAADVIEFPHA